ncbi:type II secretion system protein [Methylobacterium sp. 4-46]|uniref:type II secretion system F family protein n=1 Tax=Methylobacterium sp. (strain 4-46) TaxID=426117 RepID=UPI000152C806|nr:type II secretion system F family protein [Methylobacterium sp. 4-46]ACA16838.1 type II secretion system protein [Methylobacterium sp. 4-46]
MTSFDALIVAGLLAVTASCLAYAVVVPLLPSEARAAKRQQAIAGRRSPMERVQAVNRREQVAKSLKELEAKERKARPSLELRITQAGLSITKSQFYVASGVLAGVSLVMGLVMSGSPLTAIALAFAAGLGLPQWLLGYLRKRRIARFVLELPNAMDVIVRGIKSGLPVGDCLRIIAREAPEPVRTEFRALVESQAVGVSLSEAATKLFERMPVSEANFFAIVIGIQAKSGGNLSEALGNLSRVLRDRRRMADKVSAMSMEARASAAIIASLPFVVAVLCYFSSPDYISLLWTTQVGQIAITLSGLWMVVGVLVMKRMITFEI